MSWSAYTLVAPLLHKVHMELTEPELTGVDFREWLHSAVAGSSHCSYGYCSICVYYDAISLIFPPKHLNCMWSPIASFPGSSGGESFTTWPGNEAKSPIARLHAEAWGSNSRGRGHIGLLTVESIDNGACGDNCLRYMSELV